MADNDIALELEKDEEITTTSGEDEESNFLNEILDQVTELMGDEDEDQIRELIDKRRSILDQELVRPTDKEVIETAVEVLIRAEQERKYNEWGIKEEDPLEPEDIRQVEFNINKPEDVLVTEFGLALEALHDELTKRVEEREGDEEVNPIAETDPETMTQIVGEPKIGKQNDITILHGARNVLYNLCEELGYTDHEREIVQLAHRIAARQNGLHRFVLVNDLLLIDTTLSERVKDFDTHLPIPDFDETE